MEWVLSFMVHTFQVATVLQSSVLIDSLLVNPRLLFCGNYKKVHGSNTYRGCVHMSKAGKILSNFTSSIAPYGPLGRFANQKANTFESTKF